jgi:hypothetical protein
MKQVQSPDSDATTPKGGFYMLFPSKLTLIREACKASGRKGGEGVSGRIARLHLAGSQFGGRFNLACIHQISKTSPGGKAQVESHLEDEYGLTQRLSNSHSLQQPAMSLLQNEE